MPFIVSGPLPLITDMPFLNDWAQLPVDTLAGSPEDVINCTDQGCQPFAVSGLPILPMLFALLANERWRPLSQWAQSSLLTPPSVPVSPKEK